MANALQEVLTEFDITTVKTRGKTNEISVDEGTVEQIAACLTHSWREPSGEMCTKGERHCARISRKAGPPA